MLYSQRRRPVFSVGGGSIPSAAYFSFCSRARRFLAFASRFSSLFSRDYCQRLLFWRRVKNRSDSRGDADVGAAQFAVLGAVGARRLQTVALRAANYPGSVYAYALLAPCSPPTYADFPAPRQTESAFGSASLKLSRRRGTKRAPTDRFRHVTHAIDARLRRLSLASWSSLVTNDDRERLRRGEADSERAAAPLMATCRQERERERGGGWTARPLGAIGALLGLRRLSAIRAGADGRG